MTDLTYNSDSLFELLPSFWKDYVDRPVLEAIYEGYLRLADNDYATLFTLDDAKDATTLRPTRLQPLVHQTFDSWETHVADHKHLSLELPWPAATGNRYVIRIPDIILGPVNLIFANNALIPQFLYSFKEDWWVDGGQLKRGTVLLLDKARLTNYFLEHKLDSSILFSFSRVTPTINFGFLRILSFGYEEIRTIPIDPSATEYLLDTAADLHPNNITIDFWDITPETSITKNGSTSRIRVPTHLAQGQRGYIRLSNNECISISITSDITLDTGAHTVANVLYFVNFDLQSSITIENGKIALDAAVFPAGIPVGIRSGTTSQTYLPSTPAATLQPGCDTHAITAVTLFGTDITKIVTRNTLVSGCQTQDNPALILNRPITGAGTLKVTYRRSSDHSHKLVNMGAPLDFAALQLPTDVADTDTMLVFVNDRYAAPDLDFFWESDTAIVFTNPFTTVDRVTLFYEAAEAVPHTHHQHRNQVAQSGLTTITVDKPIISHEPVLVFADNMLRSVVSTSGTMLALNEPLATYTAYTTIYTSIGRRYSHVLPATKEPDWRHTGQLVSAERLQDGINIPTVVLTAEDFDITDTDGVYRLWTDVKIHDGWWVNAQIDEQHLQQVWGELFNFHGKSTDAYARVLGALMVAARAPSASRTVETFGSFLMGSPLTNQTGYFGGIADNTVRIITNTGSLLEQIPAHPGTPVALSSGCVLRNTNIHTYVKPVELSPAKHPWLPILLEEISSSYRAVERLDRYTTRKLTSVPFSYNKTSKLLIDYSIDFYELGVTTGDIVKVNFGYITDIFVVPPDVPMYVFSTVTAVVDAHTLFIDIPVADSLLGYGDNGYGTGGYGGALKSEGFVLSYTVWTRSKEKLDTGRTLDNLSTATLNTCARMLNAFGFGVEVAWKQMTDETRLRGLRKMLEIVTPAYAKPYVFTQAFVDNIVAPLSSTAKLAIREETPVKTFVPNVFAVEESFVGLDSVIETDGLHQTLFLPKDALMYGPNIRSVVSEDDRTAKVGQYFLISLLVQATRLATVYTAQRGIENQLVVCTSTTPNNGYTVEGVVPAHSNTRGIRLSGGYLAVSEESSTNAMVPSPVLLSYTTETPFTVSAWLRVFSSDYAVGDLAYVFKWGPIELFLRYAGGDQFTVRARTFHTSTSLNGTGRIISGDVTCVTLTYEQALAGHFVTKLYVNRTLAATSTETVDTVIDSFTALDHACYIGTRDDSDVTDRFKGDLFVLDIRHAALTAQDVVALVDTRSLPPLGITANNVPLHYADAWLTFQFHDFYTTEHVADYSGNAFSASVVGDYTTCVGDLITTRAAVGDSFIVDEYEISESGERLPVPRFSITNSLTAAPGNSTISLPNGTLLGGAAALDNTLLTYQRNGSMYSIPYIAYRMDSDATFQRFVPNAVVISTALSVDDSDLYAGFSV